MPGGLCGAGASSQRFGRWEHRPEPQDGAPGCCWRGRCGPLPLWDCCPRLRGEKFCGARPKVCGKQRSGELDGRGALRAPGSFGVSVFDEKTRRSRKLNKIYDFRWIFIVFSCFSDFPPFCMDLRTFWLRFAFGLHSVCLGPSFAVCLLMFALCLLYACFMFALVAVCFMCAFVF